MDRRGLAEVGGAALGSGVLAAGGLLVVVGRLDWVLIVGLAAGVAIAAAANYRARTKHAAKVADVAPAVTEDNYERHGRTTAGDGGVPADDDSRAGDETTDGRRGGH
ncbi:hypothetical protein ACOZ4I_00245 [Haloarcula salina]|uniref:hypothetical protein n=1 Tax=Haloarcula salina TaxID=1429914 RepID=UPI003C6EDA69